MKEELFAELLESVHEGGAILRGAKSPSRKYTVEKPDVQKKLQDKKTSRKIKTWTRAKEVGITDYHR